MQAKTITTTRRLKHILLAALLGLSVSAAGNVAASNYDAGVFEFQQKLAKGGNAQAQYQLGSMYESGRGVAKDINKAREWYEKSAANNYSAARHRLTYLEVQTGGFKPDHKPWLNELATEAKRGNGEAMFILGDMHEKGIGVKKNLERAQSYYKSSASRGNVDAENRLYDIEQKLIQHEQDQKRRQQQEAARAAKEKEAAAQQQKAEEERKARQAAANEKAREKAQADKARADRARAEQERRKLEAERRRLEAERRQLESQRKALAAQKAAEAEAAASAESEANQEEDDRFQSDLCSGKAARFRTQCQ